MNIAESCLYMKVTDRKYPEMMEKMNSQIDNIFEGCDNLMKFDKFIE